jgi:hypothetical protein
MGQRHTEERIWGPEKPKHSPADSGNNRKDKSCCFGAAAVKSAKRRQWRLARRYSVLMVRRIAGVA